MNLLRAIARPLLAAPFIVSGVDALTRPASHVQRSAPFVDVAQPVLDRIGVEVTDEQLTAASRVMGAVTVVAGVGLACGIAPRSSAAVLCALSVPIAVVNAPSSLKDRKIDEFAHRVGMIGALAIASTDRVGSPSAAWRVNAWRQTRERQRLAQTHA